MVQAKSTFRTFYLAEVLSDDDEAAKTNNGVASRGLFTSSASQLKMHQYVEHQYAEVT